MTLLAVPNISEGRDAGLITEFEQVARSESLRVLDIHSDAIHNRSVFTLTGTPAELVAGCLRLAEAAASAIDLSAHEGVHPRLGAMDVCPFVPHESPMSEAVTVARLTAEAIAGSLRLPVYLYGHAARRPETRELPDLRRGGLQALRERMSSSLPPDAGPASLDPRRGVVCVGARGPLIAFNVWLQGDVESARAVARSVRSAAVRALGLRISATESQVSMNLIDPVTTGIEEAFASVARQAELRNIRVISTELVGLVSERFLPSPDAAVTRLLKQPGHPLEACLRPAD